MYNLTVSCCLQNRAQYHILYNLHSSLVDFTYAFSSSAGSSLSGALCISFSIAARRFFSSLTDQYSKAVVQIPRAIEVAIIAHIPRYDIVSFEQVKSAKNEIYMQDQNVP